MIFSIYSDGPVDKKDWETRQGKLGDSAISTIADDLEAGNPSKVATSIPNPFARMYLFDTAFQMAKLGHKQIGYTLYNFLVSDCLDVFQLLYNIGDGSNLKFLKWNKSIELQRLKSNADIIEGSKQRIHPHRLLAQSLDMALKSDRFAGFEDIYFIFYKGILLGGTSPLTVFYTTPNFQRIMEERGEMFPPSTTNDILFDKEPAALHERAADFQTFMHKFRLAYKQTLSQNCQHLFDYIFQSGQNFSPQIIASIDPNYNLDTFLKEYSQININKTTGESLRCGNISIRSVAPDDVEKIISQNSGFVMETSVDYFKQYKADDGQLVSIPTPLALTSNNNNLIRYIYNTWDPNTTVEYFSYLKLHERKLPGTSNTKFPYVTTGDFLEDKLIKLPYSLNRKYFFTGFDGKFHYLLPIKKEYFNFFTINDLKKNLSISTDQDKIIVRLRIPIRSGNSIDFIKQYNIKGDNIKVYEPKEETRSIGMGIFPFYQVSDERELNEYVIMLVDNAEKDVYLKLFRFNDIKSSTPINYREKKRIAKSENQAGSTYYRVTGNPDNSFDLMEVSIGDYKGLIIPSFKKVEVKNHTYHYNFAIDFGTSNTHIAFNHSNDPSIKEFDIDDNEMQMVLLNEPGSSDEVNPTRDTFNYGFGQFFEVAQYKNREFVPSIIGEKSHIHYPIRTATCESSKFASEGAELFGNINIGYSLDSEERALSNTFFVTNIKWGIEKNLGGQAEKNRVKAFFHQTLWMIKNKIIMNNGKIDADICWFVPISMKMPVQNSFQTIWKEAVQEVFGKNNQCKLHRNTESTVPYYYLANQYNYYQANDALNIDIGGGTVDIIFHENSKDMAYSTSFKFAANDIWGDGITRMGGGASKKDNGFFLMIKNKMDKGELRVENETKRRFDTFYKNSLFDSSDMISFLFKYDKEFGFSSSIQAHPYLSSLLFLHYSAIVYHLAEIITEKGLNIPMYITFTGKGSEYIKIIFSDDTENHELSKFTRMLLAKFTGKEVSKSTEVRLSENPKQVTANGGIVSLNLATKKVDPGEIICYGFDKNNPPSGYVPNKRMRLNDLEGLKIPVLENIDRFIDILMNDDELNAFFNKYSITFRYGDENLKEKVKKYSEHSYNQIKAELLRDGQLTDTIEESPFFWCLKDAFYRISKEIYK
jgi:hypothetical protein